MRRWRFIILLATVLLRGLMAIKLFSLYGEADMVSSEESIMDDYHLSNNISRMEGCHELYPQSHLFSKSAINPNETIQDDRGKAKPGI